jgi:hypothetical protein
MCIDIQNGDFFTSELSAGLFVKLDVHTKNVHSIGVVYETVKPEINFFSYHYSTCF